MSKNKILTIAFLTLFVLSFTHNKSNAQEVKWYTFTEAIELNKKQPRNIFIDVYTDWCHWCKVMDSKTFTNPTIAKILNEKFYAVKLNAERKDTVVFQGNAFVSTGQGKRPPHQLAAALLQGKMSYPSIVFLNDKNQLITAMGGYQKPEDLEPLLIFIHGSLYNKKIDYQEFKNNYISK